MKKTLLTLAILISVSVQAKEINDKYIFETLFKEHAPDNVDDIKVIFDGRNETDSDSFKHFNSYKIEFKQNSQAFKCFVVRRDINAEKFFGDDKQFVYAYVSQCENSKESFKFNGNSIKAKLVKLFWDNGKQSRDLTDSELKEYLDRVNGRTTVSVAPSVTSAANGRAGSDNGDDDAPKKSKSILNHGLVTHGAAVVGGAVIGYGVSKLLQKKSTIVPVASSDLTTVVSSDSTTVPTSSDETEPIAEPIMADENQD